MKITALACAVGWVCSAAAGQTTISVSFDAGVRAEPATGRLVVYTVREGSRVPAGAAPSDGPFWDDPQPMYGVDVKGLKPGESAMVGDAATAFPVKLSELPKGTYRVQAVLDMSRASSNWRQEPGNLYSEPVTVEIGTGGAEVRVPLTRAVGARAPDPVEGVEYFTVRSALLSAFHGREVVLRAGVMLPLAYDAAGERPYPAVYEVPGFGGDSTSVAWRAMGARRAAPGSAEARLAAAAFWITLDPESGNGHTLFADSVNNGPWGRALTEELIPALEGKYRLIAKPSARLLRGHSSGGWSTLWLALKYPGTFGAAWSTSPDPVDFRKFQLADIYAGGNAYTGGSGEKVGGDVVSYRSGGAPKMTVRQENLMEEVLGPWNTSGQQWDSWLAVWGPRAGDGNPAALYDPRTGDIDRAVAEQFRKYDIGELVRAEPGLYGPILLQRVRLAVGDQDNFYLNEAVALLKAEVDGMSFLHLPEGGHGWIKIVPGVDHGSIFRTPELRAFPQEMLDHLARAGHIPAP